MAKKPQSTILTNLDQAVTRLFAGAASPMSDLFNPEAFSNVKGLPNVSNIKPAANLEQVPAGLYQLYNLASALSGGAIPKANVPYLDRASERMMENDTHMRNVLGISEPKNLIDVGLEVAGGLITPGPKKLPAGVSSVVRMKPTTVLGKAAEGTRKVATETGKILTEAALPLRQGQSLTKAALTQVPLAAGITEGVDALVKSPEYTSIADIVSNEEPVSAMEMPLEQFIPEELIPTYQEALNTQDQELAADVLDVAAQLQEQEAAKEYLPEEPAWKDPATTALAFGALGIGALGVRSVINKMVASNLSPSTNLSKLTGQGRVNQITPAGVKIAQDNIQHDASLRWAGELLFGKNTAEHDKFLAKLDSVTSAPLSTKIQHAQTTGEMPNSAITSNPLRATLEAFARDVDDAEWQVVSDGLLARNALDDFKRTGNQAAFNDKTPTELEQIAQRLDNDPKLSAYGELIKQHYRDLLDYALEQGLITTKAHGELIAARPNFVHMSRNIADDGSNSIFSSRGAVSRNADEQRNRVFQRSTDEFGGVQVGKTADPIAELPGQFDRIIKQAEINRVKKDFLEKAVANSELSSVIKKIPTGETPNSMEGITEVINNGIKEYYKVSDPAFRAALDFSPNAAVGMLSTVLGVPKKVAQTFITGAGNPLFSATSAAYDTITGIMLKPRGYDLGLLNEFKNNILPKSLQNNPVIKESSEWISRFDPTVWASAPIGAVRLGYDELVGAMAHDLQSRLLKNQDWFVDLIGGKQNASIVQQRLSSMYDASVKSLMDKTGALTSNQLNPQDVATQARGMVDIAPKFFARANQRAYQEALEGGTSFAEGMLLNSRNTFDQARASTIARGYMNLVRLLHEGFRYQAFATNLPKVIGDTELEELLASQTRRIAGDIGQTGASQLYQEVAKSAMYMNVGVQTLAEVGRKFKRQPLTTTANIASAMTMMLGMQYLYAASDPERAKEIANLTDDEQTRLVRTSVGDIPVPPELRLLWGPTTALINEVTGVNSGQMDPNAINAFIQWADNGYDLGEVGNMSVADSASSALESIIPINAGSNPAINSLAAMGGLDLSMSRYTGKPQDIKSQSISGVGGNGKFTDEAINATWQKIIQELGGTATSNFIRTGLDFDRALSGGGSLDDAARVALSRLTDNAAKQAGPISGMLFGDYEKVKNLSDTEYNMYYKKKEGIDKATQTLRQDVLQQYVTGADPRYAMIRNVDIPLEDNNLAQTAVAPIGAIAAELAKTLRPYQLRMNEYKDQVAFTQNQKLSGIEDRNIAINQFNEERKALAQEMLYITQMYEDQVRTLIGDPSFTFQNYDPRAYADVPWPPPQPAIEPQSAQP